LGLWYVQFHSTVSKKVLLLLFTQKHGRNAADAVRQLVLDMAMAAFRSVFAILAFTPPVCMEGGLYHWLFVHVNYRLARLTIGFGLVSLPVRFFP
jgi:hypothetical protein